jgi:hypothetical protein
MFKNEDKKREEAVPGVRELGYVYGVLLRAFDGTVTASEAVELIRAELCRKGGPA